MYFSWTAYRKLNCLRKVHKRDRQISVIRSNCHSTWTRAYLCTPSILHLQEIPIVRTLHDKIWHFVWRMRYCLLLLSLYLIICLLYELHQKRSRLYWKEFESTCSEEMILQIRQKFCPLPSCPRHLCPFNTAIRILPRVQKRRVLLLECYSEFSLNESSIPLNCFELWYALLHFSRLISWNLTFLLTYLLLWKVGDVKNLSSFSASIKIRALNWQSNAA